MERPDWAHRLPPSARGSAYAVMGDNVLAAAGRVSLVLGLEGLHCSLELAFGSGKEDGTPGQKEKELPKAIAFAWSADPPCGAVGALPKARASLLNANLSELPKSRGRIMTYRRRSFSWIDPPS